jgi:hypothetical protein
MSISLRASAIVDLAFGPKDVGALDWTPLDVSAAKNDASSCDISLVNNHEATARSHLVLEMIESLAQKSL